MTPRRRIFLVDDNEGLDVLVTNAGISGATAPVVDFPVDTWNAVVNVNLTGTFMVTPRAILCSGSPLPAPRGSRQGLQKCLAIGTGVAGTIEQTVTC